MSLQWVVFRVSDQEYALGVDQVVEVLRMASLTPVAESPAGFAGILNLRGQAVPVLDLVQRLAGIRRPADPDQAIVIVSHQQRLVGLVVDAVDEVVNLDEASIRPPDRLLGDKTPYLGVARWDQRVLLLLDIDRLIVGDGHMVEPVRN
jgi:purine-binding chemotaxis protein CheW